MKKHGATKQAIIEVILNIQNRYGKQYCFPTQKKIIELLEKYHGIKIQRRALCYALAALEVEGLIVRKRRLAKGRFGELIFRSTLYFFSRAGHAFMAHVQKYSAKIAHWSLSGNLNREMRRAAKKGNLKFSTDSLIFGEGL
jgi:repressor of nif and glnA expression